MLIPSFVRQRLTLALTAAALATPSLLAAQNKFSVTPWVGSYYALSKFYNENISLDSLGIGTGLTKVTVGQENTVMVGVRVSLPIGPTLAGEGSFGYASSNVRFILKDPTGTGGFDAATTNKGNVIIGSLRLVFKPRRSNLSLIAGGIIVNHGGKFWDDSTLTKKTNFGGVAGIGLRANVTPRFPIDIRAEANFYNFNPDKGDNALNGFYPGKMQSDLVFSVGIPLGGR